MTFNGSWKVDRSENYDKFMEKMGVNIVKRKLAAHDNLKLTITQEGNKFTVKESSAFRTIEIVFDLGVNFKYSLADGTELSVTWNLKENKQFLPSSQPSFKVTFLRLQVKQLVLFTHFWYMHDPLKK
ncbi:fatty acid-binding protein, intestinal [Octodon degus]|uniref:Fatty acid-binding protein, intestinal n=1 Tax=Octodon degus TaxID=10160 RepID=A0A6P6DKK9_OCTDE|nr:fatty acid-binding protein, intestinal [Octodon degus]